MRFAGGMGIERFGAEGDVGRVRECYEIFRAVMAANDPEVPAMARRAFEGWLQSGLMGEPRETWLITDQQEVAGWYLLALPSRDNKHLAGLDIMIRPDRRRRGLGTALLRHAAEQAQTGE